MRSLANTIRYFALLLLFFVVGCILTGLSPALPFPLSKSSSLYYLVLCVVLTLYFSARLVTDRIRKYMISIGGMLTNWMLLRAVSHICFQDAITVQRLIWYAYDLPSLFVPTLSFLAAFSAGLPEEKRLPRLCLLPVLISLAFAVTVMTNDLHGLVFSFPHGLGHWEFACTRGVLYYLMFLWCGGLLVASVGILIAKNDMISRKSQVWLLLVPILFGLILMVPDIFGSVPAPYGRKVYAAPEIGTFMMGGVWITAITVGLLPTNKGYGRLMTHTGISVQIADRDLRVVYRSPSALALSREQLASDQPVSADPDLLLSKTSVPGGFVYWCTDVSELNRVHQELEEAHDLIAEENDLIRMENDLHVKRTLIDVQTETYEAISVRVLPQSMVIARLAQEAEADPALYEKNMRQVCILAAYVKRLSNLMLFSASSEKLPAKELFLALRETARYLEKAGIHTHVSDQSEGQFVSSVSATDVYERFEAFLEKGLASLRGVTCVLLPDRLKCIFEGATPLLPEDGPDTYEVDGDTFFVTLFLEGGDIA